MEIIKTLDEMKAWSRKMREGGKTIGLVPTMGYLHEGHLSLARKSIGTCDQTVVSIFVNPKQFGPNEDLDTYPRDLEADQRALEQLGVNGVRADAWWGVDLAVPGQRFWAWRVGGAGGRELASDRKSRCVL